MGDTKLDFVALSGPFEASKVILNLFVLLILIGVVGKLFPGLSMFESSIDSKPVLFCGGMGDWSLALSELMFESAEEAKFFFEILTSLPYISCDLNCWVVFLVGERPMIMFGAAIVLTGDLELPLFLFLNSFLSWK